MNNSLLLGRNPCITIERVSSSLSLSSNLCLTFKLVRDAEAKICQETPTASPPVFPPTPRSSGGCEASNMFIALCFCAATST